MGVGRIVYGMSAHPESIVAGARVVPRKPVRILAHGYAYRGARDARLPQRPLAVDIVRRLASTVTAQLRVLETLGCGLEANMLFKIAMLLLVAWLLGVLGVYRVGDLVHALLLVALMLLLLTFVRAREAAVARSRSGPTDKP